MKAPEVVGMTFDTIWERMSVVRGSWWVGSCTGSGYAGVPGRTQGGMDQNSATTPLNTAGE